LSFIQSYLRKKQDSSSLAIFRLGFGILMTISIIRFWQKGWIETLYLDPSFHFSFYGFEWVKPIGEYTYLIFLICATSAFLVAIGYKYYLSIIVFFLSFTYIELMDKTTYLNHYYFISILSFLMIFLPCNANFSVDNLINKKKYTFVSKWNVDSIKMLLFIVYFYSGLAKINSDWLLNAQPLKIWLMSNYDLPIIGDTIMQKEWFHYAMSWSGMFYDLLIPFLLIYNKTRVYAFLLVVFFHLFTAVLFPIGMFPYIMIIAALIFFDPETHKKILIRITAFLNLSNIKSAIKESRYFTNQKEKFSLFIITIFFIFQIAFPFRHVFYPGELFWNEQGYRFSWRVMLIEKKGYSTFKIVDGDSEKSFYVMNEEFLTELQERQMSFQPDFILEYAHYLGNHFTDKGISQVEVYVDSYVTLNGRMNKRFINPHIDLMKEKRGFKNKEWILPLNEKIKGF
tara:strand:+ start:1265 stop:2626 length:1362 start_codon:yes stop_codon:yes gene_type:complete